MIVVNPVTISSPTRFQVSFDLAPPYPNASEIQVAGDGTWSVQCGVVERLTATPGAEYGTIFTEASHNIAPHDGEPVPCVNALYNYTGVDVETIPWDPENGGHAYCIAMDPVRHGEDGHFDKAWMIYHQRLDAGKRAWRVEVNVIHGTETEVRDAHRVRRGGCLFPWWSMALPLGYDHGKANFELMLARGEIQVGAVPEPASAPPKPRAKRKPAKKK